MVHRGKQARQWATGRSPHGARPLCWSTAPAMSPLAHVSPVGRRLAPLAAALLVSLLVACGSPGPSEPERSLHALDPDLRPVPCLAARWPSEARVQWSVGSGWAALFEGLSPAPRLWPSGLQAGGPQHWAWTRWERSPQVASVGASREDWRWVLRREGWHPWDVEGALHTWWQPLEGRALCLSEDRVLVGEIRQMGRLLEAEEETGSLPRLPEGCEDRGAALALRRTGAVDGLLRAGGAAPHAWPAWMRVEFCQVAEGVRSVVLLPAQGSEVGLVLVQEAWTRLPGRAPRWSCGTLPWLGASLVGCASLLPLEGFALRMGWVTRWLDGPGGR